MYNYAGIGSRETPEKYLTLMKKLAAKLANLGYTLRSGGAQGADSAFEEGCDLVDGKKEIFVPWKGFNKSTSTLFPDVMHHEKAATIHPVWDKLTPAVQKLHARNTMQILGKDLQSPVEFVLCWTPDGAENSSEVTKDTGGTGTAIRLASDSGILIYNLANASSVALMEEKISLLESVHGQDTAY